MGLPHCYQRWSAAPPTSLFCRPRNPPAARAPGGAERRNAASPVPRCVSLFLVALALLSFHTRSGSSSCSARHRVDEHPGILVGRM